MDSKIARQMLVIAEPHHRYLYYLFKQTALQRGFSRQSEPLITINMACLVASKSSGGKRSGLRIVFRSAVEKTFELRYYVYPLNYIRDYLTNGYDWIFIVPYF